MEWPPRARVLLLAFGCLFGGFPAKAVDYYVSPSGSDSNSGLSPAAAWQTLGRVYSVALQPGDRVLLEGGSTFGGMLYLEGQSGTAAEPITIASFGAGRAKIAAGSSHGIYIYNAGGYVVRDVDIEGSGLLSNTGSGIFFYTDLPGFRPRIEIRHVTVSGFGRGTGLRGTGIEFLSWREDSVLTGYDGILVEDSVIHGNETGGFGTWSHQPYGMRNVSVRRSVFHGNPGRAGLTNPSGSGLVLGRVDVGLVEFCRAYNNGASNTNSAGPVGIWAYDSRDIAIQHNIAHDNKSSGGDGGGFDLDGGVTDSVMQYNYSYNNDGAGYLLAQYDGAPPFGNNIVRYNISQNDGRRSGYGGIHLWAHSPSNRVRDTQIYHNTVWVTAAAGTPSAFRMQGSNFSGMKVWNNIFHTSGGGTVRTINADSASPLGDVQFQGNVYSSEGPPVNIKYGSPVYSSLAAWRTATGQEVLSGVNTGLEGNAGFELAGVPTGIIDPAVLPHMLHFRLSRHSPARDQGLDLRTLFGVLPTGRDFFGPAGIFGAAPDPGAHEYGPAFFRWQHAHYSLEEVEGGFAAEEATAPSGVPNLVAYATGSDPHDPAAAGLPTLSVFSHGTPFPTLTRLGFHIRTDDPALNFLVERSSNLKDWGPGGSIIDSEPLSAELMRLLVEDSIPLEHVGRAFLRLRVHLDPDEF